MGPALGFADDKHSMFRFASANGLFTSVESSNVHVLYRIFRPASFRVFSEKSMASDIAIERIRKDTEAWRGLAGRILRLTEPGVLTDNEVDFLEQIQERSWLDELSYRQAEWLLGIRDNVEQVASYRGFSLTRLIRRCYESRFDLDDREQRWISRLFERREEPIRARDARRIYSIAQRQGEVDRFA
jgi:hypothetical protein